VAYEVVMPAMEMDQESATLLQWLKPEGALVAEGEPLMEIETDKVTVEIEAPASGILESLSAHPGDVVPVGKVVALIRAAGDRPAPTPAPAVEATPAVEPAPVVETAPAVETAPVPYRVVPVRGVQAQVAARVHRSYTAAPHIALRRTIDASALVEAVPPAGAEDPAGGPTLLSLVLATCARTLLDHPLLNAHLVDDELRLWSDVHLGVAVSVAGALLVPVIRNADRKSPAQLAADVSDLAERTRDSRISPAELRGSTFSVSNLGRYAVDDFTAILNPPEVGILAMGRIEQRPVVRAPGSVVAAPALTLTLCVDHRAVNGAEAAEFLTDLARRLQDPPGRAG
jgi:pyruvate dehydrogenase E2 component (dihydrolipoamide acetyltransferase)